MRSAQADIRRDRMVSEIHRCGEDRNETGDHQPDVCNAGHDHRPGDQRYSEEARVVKCDQYSGCCRCTEACHECGTDGFQAWGLGNRDGRNHNGVERGDPDD